MIDNYDLIDEDLIEPTKENVEYDKSKPSICMVGWHTCVRVTKQVMVLWKKRYRLGLISNRIPMSQGMFSDVHIYYDDVQLKRAIEESKDRYDIFHVHNEPNALFLRVKSIVKDKPVILDFHDLDILRKGYCRESEIMSVVRSDAMVHVSNEINQYITELYDYKKPSITIESRCPSEFVFGDEVENRSGIVYQGGVRLPEDVGDFSYRNIFPIINAFSSEGYDFHLYCPSNNPITNKYRESGALCHGSREYMDLLKELKKYQWGWSGFIQDPPKNHVKWALTNKFWEYINCGVPVLVYNTEVQAKYVEKYRIGIVIRSLKNLRKQIEIYDWEELRNNVLLCREELNMDNHIEPLENLYKSLV